MGNSEAAHSVSTALYASSPTVLRVYVCACCASSVLVCVLASPSV